MNGLGSGRVAAAALWLAGFAPEASNAGLGLSFQSKRMLQVTILQALWHPVLDMHVQLTSEQTAVGACMFAYDLPSSFELVRANSAGVEGHLGTVDSSKDAVGSCGG